MDILDTTAVFISLTNFIHLYSVARDFVSQVHNSANKIYLNSKLEKEIKKEEIIISFFFKKIICISNSQ